MRLLQCGVSNASLLPLVSSYEFKFEYPEAISKNSISLFSFEKKYKSVVKTNVRVFFLKHNLDLITIYIHTCVCFEYIVRDFPF